MKEYILAIFPADFKHNKAYWRAFILGLVFLVFAVAQLFKFEEFPGIITMMRVPGAPFTAWFLAIVLPLLEIASLPYLLSMRLKYTHARAISMWSGVAVSVLWVLLTVWTSIQMGMAVESGMFGGTLATNSGWWSVVVMVLLLWSYWLTMRELPKRRES